MSAALDQKALEVAAKELRGMNIECESSYEDFAASIITTYEAAKPSPWHPYQTAPMDATPVDLWVSGERVPNAHIDKRRLCWVHWGLDDFDRMGWVRVQGNITHWMPIPAAPKESE